MSELLGNLVQAFDKKHKAIALCIDLRKAFDSIQHNVLLSKLELHGKFSCGFFIPTK